MNRYDRMRSLLTMPQIFDPRVPPRRFKALKFTAHGEERRARCDNAPIEVVLAAEAQLYVSEVDVRRRVFVRRVFVRPT